VRRLKGAGAADALFLIYKAVARRRSLIHGRLRKGAGRCAMGCFWDDHPGVTLHATLIDEVAAVNDSLPLKASPHERWKKVNAWLKWKVGMLSRKRR
jgi:hypothetical protein